MDRGETGIAQEFRRLSAATTAAAIDDHRLLGIEHRLGFFHKTFLGKRHPFRTFQMALCPFLLGSDIEQLGSRLDLRRRLLDLDRLVLGHLFGPVRYTC